MLSVLAYDILTSERHDGRVALTMCGWNGFTLRSNIFRQTGGIDSPLGLVWHRCKGLGTTRT